MKTATVLPRDLSSGSWLAEDNIRTRAFFSMKDFERLLYLTKRRRQLLRQVALIDEKERILLDSAKERSQDGES